MRLLDALVAERSRPLPARMPQRDGGGGGFTFGGVSYGLGQMPQMTTLYGKNPSEPIGSDFQGLVTGALQADGVVSAIELVRILVFSEARFQWQRMQGGRPGDLFGTTDLNILDHPWPGGTTGDLLAQMLLDADMAGNWYGTVIDGQVVRLRPDWVDIIMAPRVVPYGAGMSDVQVGFERIGYAYYQGGKIENRDKPAYFTADEVAHFAPYPDPLASYRGMSWLTPVVREIMADKSASDHKLKFFEHAATPNLAISLPKELDIEDFNLFVDAMERDHAGTENAYKTLYTGGGADVTVVGANMQQLDFKTTQGAGETRIAAAGRIHPVIVGLSEGMAGSSLNAGNYQAAKRSTADSLFRPLWRNACGSLETLVTKPTIRLGEDIPPRLWVDDRDIAFLREDLRDQADIQAQEALTIRTLTDAGYTPESAVRAVLNNDWSMLAHSGLFSVQLQAPGSGQTPPVK